MPTLNYSVAVSGLGGNIAQSLPRSANAGGIREIELPVGKAGTLTTLTDDNTGTITMSDAGFPFDFTGGFMPRGLPPFHVARPSATMRSAQAGAAG